VHFKCIPLAVVFQLNLLYQSISTNGIKKKIKTCNNTANYFINIEQKGVFESPPQLINTSVYEYIFIPTYKILPI